MEKRDAMSAKKNSCRLSNKSNRARKTRKEKKEKTDEGL